MSLIDAAISGVTSGSSPVIAAIITDTRPKSLKIQAGAVLGLGA